MANVNTTTEVALDIHEMGLQGKQKRFVLHYAGDGTAAAKLAGYKPDSKGRYDHHARRLLANPTVIEALKRRDTIMKQLPHSTDPVMSVDQLRQWWTGIITDAGNDLKDRINCSKLLAQSYGAFIEKLIVEETSVKIDLKAELKGLLPHEVEMLKREHLLEGAIDAKMVEHKPKGHQ